MYVPYSLLNKIIYTLYCVFVIIYHIIEQNDYKIPCESGGIPFDSPIGKELTLHYKKKKTKEPIQY